MVTGPLAVVWCFDADAAVGEKRITALANAAQICLNIDIQVYVTGACAV